MSFWKALATPPTPPGPEFTPRAQQVLALAREEAVRFRHQFVGTEHLLLGQIRLGQGVAVNVLGRMGLDLETVRLEVEKQVGMGPDEKVSGFTPYTPRVKEVLALADKERRALNHTYLGTEHILLGLLGEGDGVAPRVLRAFGVNMEDTRQIILSELDPNYLFPPEDIAMLQKSESQGPREATIDISKRYDVYCREGDQEVVYRNALFKGTKALGDRDFFPEYIELEQADGRTIFIAMSTMMKFCEHGNTPGSEAVSNRQS